MEIKYNKGIEDIRLALIEFFKKNYDNQSYIYVSPFDGIITVDDAVDWIKNANRHKFKHGDWISSYNGIYFKVLDTDTDGYYVEDIYGTKDHILFINEKFYRLWSIVDAKNGDILTTNDGRPFIYNGEHIRRFIIGGYGGIDSDGNFKALSEDEITWTITETFNEIHPADSEERGLLFKKMYDSGYAWDFKIKALVKF